MKMEKLCMWYLVSKSRTPALESACSRLYSSIFSGRMPTTMPTRLIGFGACAAAPSQTLNPASTTARLTHFT